MTKRIPVYLLIDTSREMKGEPIESIKVIIDSLIRIMKCDTYTLESGYISIITYNSEVKQILPLTSIERINEIPELLIKDSDIGNIEEAFKVLPNIINKEVNKGSIERKGDWKPILFLFAYHLPICVLEGSETILTDILNKFYSTIIFVENNTIIQTKRCRLANNVYHLKEFNSSDLSSSIRLINPIDIPSFETNDVISDVELPPIPEFPDIII